MFSKQHQLDAALFHVLHHGDLQRSFAGNAADWRAFEARLCANFPALCQELAAIYGEHAEFLNELRSLVRLAADSWRARPVDLKTLDAAREAAPQWFQSNAMVGGVCYVDRYAGNLQGVRDQIPYFKELGLTFLHLMPLFACPAENSDGGYAVSSYRSVREDLGTIEELQALATDLRANGISLVIDFIFNHTSNEHAWAKQAAAGDPTFSNYYWMFPDRQGPDAYERTTREIFPDDHPGSFVQLADGRWVWATFYSFQWDLNYSNPEVFRAMAGEMLFLSNLGIDILRMDAVAFIWKRLGTSCENLPQAHTLIRAFNAVCRIAAPSLLFKSEAIVHPDEVVSYIRATECQLSYNPLLMALGWEALATRDTGLLSQALSRRQAIDPACSWVNYVRCHDDIGWTFADEDAAELGIIGFDHRRFLNSYYVNRYPGSFARGVPFQDNPKTGDCRIAGTCASLAGVEAGDDGGVDRVLLLHSIALSAGGMPLIYLGDEVGQLNDYSYADDPASASDSRWVHRPRRPASLYDSRKDAKTVAGEIFGGLTKLLSVRRKTPELGGGRIQDFQTGHASVLGYQRPSANWNVLVLANFGDEEVDLPGRLFTALPPRVQDLVADHSVHLRVGLKLGAHQFVWLRFKNWA